jgi:hypothetical protein
MPGACAAAFAPETRRRCAGRYGTLHCWFDPSLRVPRFSWVPSVVSNAGR